MDSIRKNLSVAYRARSGTLKTVQLTLLILCTLLLNGCAQETSSTENSWTNIQGRDDGATLERTAIYRAQIPSSWAAVDSPSTSIADTMLPIGEWYIKTSSGQIRITLHNFPSAQLVQRIPPSAQIERWQQQFDSLDPLLMTIKPTSQGGFGGLQIEATGTLKGEPHSLLGWSMQLARQHYQQLSLGDAPSHKQQRADYTIKVLGPPDLMQKQRKAIMAFAKSFELIEEIPTP